MTQKTCEQCPLLKDARSKLAREEMTSGAWRQACDSMEVSYLSMRTLARILAAIIIALVTFIATKAFAWPENFRHGYPSCSTCHVDPRGGGVLTNYGRGVANAALTASKGAKLGLPSWYTVGFDHRRGNVNVKAGDFELHRKVHMQTEGELALRPLPGLTVAGTIGTYGDQEQQEYRRNYVMLSFPYAHVRAGRFLQPFGINTPDHTDWVRVDMELGQGSEQYAVEVIGLSRWGELAFSRAVGPTLDVNGTAVDGYKTTDSGEERAYARLSGFLPWWHSQVGASARWKGNALDGGGIHAMTAPWPWAYLVVDSAYRTSERALTTSTKLGVEPLQGYHAFATYETRKEAYRAGAGVQLLPVYGVEVTVRATRTFSKDAPATDEVVGVLHVYL